MKFKPFPNPPIKEAIFDIRADLPPGANSATLLTFHDAIKEQFPNKKDRMRLQASFQFEAGLPPRAAAPLNTVDGYLFETANKDKIVQARLDGFTFNKLKPYSNWDEFSKEAFSLWAHYIRIAKPINVTRLALRYINRVEIPLPVKDLKEYILTIPDLPPATSGSASDFFTRIVLQSPEYGATAIITENIEPKQIKDDKLPLIFDLDVFKVVQLRPESDEILRFMEELRNYKDELFFNSFTDKAKELFK